MDGEEPNLLHLAHPEYADWSNYCKAGPPLKLLPDEVDDLHATIEAHYTPAWGVVGGAAALGKMRKTASPSSKPAA